MHSRKPVDTEFSYQVEFNVQDNFQGIWYDEDMVILNVHFELPIMCDERKVTFLQQ